MKAQAATRQLESIAHRTFLCPSCSALRISRRIDTPRKRPRLQRHASTLSTTAINGTRPIPPRNQALYVALQQVKTTASAHVNLGRLQLALQGLESDHPVTRIAVLGLNVQDAAVRLVRLLFADALESEAPWEKQLIQYRGEDGLLIRYGQPLNTNLPQRSTLPILQIPSPTLETLNTEFLITSVNSAHIDRTGVPAEAFLAPAVGVPTAFDGRTVTVNQPVHSALLIADGFEELVAAIDLLAATKFTSEHDEKAVIPLANLRGTHTQTHSRVLLSDIGRAEKGLQAIRQSTAQANVYGQDWTSSGMPQISDWLEANAVGTRDTPPKPVRDLVQSLLASAHASIDRAAASATQDAQASLMDAATRTRISEAIDAFSRAAHMELQAGLASAWSSRNWRKLSWYKLFWRVDDVGLIISDLVTNSWLPKTERATYELSGRLTQIGISPTMAEQQIPETQTVTAFEQETAKATILDPVPPLLAAATTAPANEIVVPEATEPVVRNSATTGKTTVELRPARAPVPITSTISSARSSYMQNQITALTSTAQQLVFRTLSISGMSAGFSALVYVSQIAPTLYEAGTLFAVGTVFALYRMQSGWQTATKAFERGLFSEGRDVIRRVVQRMRELVEKKATEVASGDPIEKTMIEDARRAVTEAKKELDALREKP